MKKTFPDGRVREIKIIINHLISGSFVWRDVNLNRINYQEKFFFNVMFQKKIATF